MAIRPSLPRTITRCHRELDEMFPLHQEPEGLLPQLDGASDEAWRATLRAPFTAARDSALADGRIVVEGMGLP